MKLKLGILPHSPNWYDRLATLQDGYYYPWNSRVAQKNGEDAYLELLHKYLTPDLDVLDVACGHGGVPVSIAPFCQSVLAYDRVSRYIKIAQAAAQEKGLENITFVCADSSLEANNGKSKIPAESKAFDLLISRRGPLHWLEDARRVARPGARILQLNPMETPIPKWAERLPEPLRSSTGIEYNDGMLNSVRYRLQLGGLVLNSAWSFDVPEFFEDPKELYIRLSWGYLQGEVPSWDGVKERIFEIFDEFAGNDGLIMRHTRLLWTAIVD